MLPVGTELVLVGAGVAQAPVEILPLLGGRVVVVGGWVRRSCFG